MGTEKGLFKHDTDRVTQLDFQISSWFLDNAQSFVRAAQYAIATLLSGDASLPDAGPKILARLLRAVHGSSALSGFVLTTAMLFVIQPGERLRISGNLKRTQTIVCFHSVKACQPE